MTTDIETEGTCGVCGSEIAVADGRVVRVGKLLDPRIEQVVEAARFHECIWGGRSHEDRYGGTPCPICEALGALDE